MKLGDSDLEMRHETMNFRFGLCLRFTILTPYSVFALSVERTQCNATLYQNIMLLNYSTMIQEQSGQLVFGISREPIAITSTTVPDTAMSRDRSEFNKDHDDVLSDHESDIDFSHSPPHPSRSITNIEPYGEQAFADLHQSIEDDSFFSMSRSEVLQVLKRAFKKELEYLKSAYAAACPGPADLQSQSPSELLFHRRVPEIDRTLTGILALRWLRNNDYDSFTQNQISTSRLSRRSFRELRAFFDAGLGGYTDHEAVFTLVVMQMTNDLGKSSALAHDLQIRLPAGRHVSGNHDMVMQQVLQYSHHLVPSIQHLSRHQRSLVHKLIVLSAEFNPGQLVQAESSPATLDTLVELHVDSAELDMKFMELFLDVAGARGHVDHEGAATMNEPTFQGYMQARVQSQKVTDGQLRPEQAYEGMLQHRLDMLSDAGYIHDLDVTQSRKAVAKARLLCMGRVADPVIAEFYEDVYEQLPAYTQGGLERGLNIYATPAVQPTYMPAMLSWVRGPKRAEQLAALLTYLARMVQLSEEDLSALPDDVEIVERDVKDILEPLVKSDAFREKPFSVVNDDTELPVMEIAKRSSAHSHSSDS